MEALSEFPSGASIRIYNKTGNPENMVEELGDVLLQVVMHAQIASEEGLFTMLIYLFQDFDRSGQRWKLFRNFPQGRFHPILILFLLLKGIFCLTCQVKADINMYRRFSRET